MKSSTEKTYGSVHLSEVNQAKLNNSSAKFFDELVTAKEITAALRIGNTKWWEGVRSGIYPAPIRIGKRCTRWRKSMINELIAHGV